MMKLKDEIYILIYPESLWADCFGNHPLHVGSGRDVTYDSKITCG